MSSSSLTISRTHYFRLVTGTVTMLSYVHRHNKRIQARWSRMKKGESHGFVAHTFPVRGERVSLTGILCMSGALLFCRV